MEAPPYRHALVIGMGRSGKAAAALLRDLGVEVRAYDQRADPGPLPRGCVPWLGQPSPPEAAFEGIDLLVLSPGVDPRPHLAAHARHCPTASVHGELSLGLEIAEGVWPSMPRVLVTGTNGKSTVTALTGHLLEAAGFRPFVGGNLAVPLCEAIVEQRSADGPPPGALVLECSSYQLETLRPVHTDVAMLLNLTADHLDRYDDMAHYGATKARIFSGLGPEGLALLDGEDPWCRRLVPQDRPHRLLQLPPGPQLRGEGEDAELWVDDAGGRWLRRELPLAGRHNAKNALFALAAARHLGVSPDTCLGGLRSFLGLPHRMRQIAERGGVVFFDDSKATNVAAVLASLDGFERPFVLIAGGRAKGDDLGPLGTLLRDRARGLVAIGEAQAQFMRLAGAELPAERAGDMDEAVRRAFALARPGDAVVLSPACASWDMYGSYAERGEAFAAAVRGL